MTTFDPTSVGFVNLTVTRPGTGGTYVLGLYQEPVAATFVIKANIQPCDFEILRKMPELERADDVIVVFTPTVLKVGSRSNKQKADYFTWNGGVYEVFKAGTFSMGVQNHTEAICARISS